MWWLYKGKFYVEDEALSLKQVSNRAVALLAKRRRVDQKAELLASQASELAEKGRDPIPDAVKTFVWQRDSGRCVECGTKQRLEFDHIIPLALGGSSSARNLQLLCEGCNRKKGATLGVRE